MTPRQSRALARRIARRLFTNGAGQQAERLVLMVDGPPKRDLGGWCMRAAVDEIVGVLQRMPRTWATPGEKAEVAELSAVVAQQHTAGLRAIEDRRRMQERIDALTGALEMVRDADDDCGRDGLPTIPAPARARIDEVLGGKA